MHERCRRSRRACTCGIQDMLAGGTSPAQLSRDLRSAGLAQRQAADGVESPYEVYAIEDCYEADLVKRACGGASFHGVVGAGGASAGPPSNAGGASTFGGPITCRRAGYYVNSGADKRAARCGPPYPEYWAIARR